MSDQRSRPVGVPVLAGVPVPVTVQVQVPPERPASSAERLEQQPTGTTEQKTATMESELAAITVSARIYPFWKDMPKQWFNQFEAIVGPQKMSKEAKFDLVVGKLGREELTTIGDILDNTERNYDTLKARLIKAFQESADRQFNKLVKEMDLGEQKPSQLYRRMAEAARDANVAEETVRRLWLQRLPTASRALLAMVPESAKLEELAAMADKVQESMGSGVIAAVATPESQLTTAINTDLISGFRDMALEIRQLRTEVNELRSRPPTRDFRRNRNRSRSRSRGTNRNPNWLCRYHFKFRENARSCTQPCAWGRQQPSAGVAPPTAYTWQQQSAGAEPPTAFNWQPPQGN
ncbi:uncharacterized protein LOC125240481 [Leguminivora glycinivorella]|uniref:uncharacterized protein LOC125240481 n=1 Tax=Leguminivora glycinivorella TaxID=1035111 RepID=UPI00200C6C16|nr:uncharacterized protein LOC125240481 [Leguminivora glycinivorella]